MAQGGWAQQTAAGPAPGVTFGGFWIRFVAYVIDAIILAIVAGILGRVAGSAGTGLAGIVEIAYFIGFWGTTGQTIGMMPFNLRIVRNADGGKLTWGGAILCYIGFIISVICLTIGLIWAAFDSRKRGWHDMIGGTVVIRGGQ